MEQTNQQQPSIKVEIPNQLDAIYSNFAIINHSPSEVIIDFAQILPNAPRARVQARVMLTPINAKALYNALRDNIARYEQQFGPITYPGQGDHEADLGGMVWRVAPETS